jgi:anti-sigma-K factor RskA
MHMKNNKKENLRELFEKFLDSHKAQQAAEDIKSAEQILEKYSTPAPSAQLLQDIKARVAIKAAARRKAIAFRRVAYRVAATAAVVIITISVGIKLFEKEMPAPKMLALDLAIPATTWDSNNLAEDDDHSATLVAEIEQIERDLLALQLDENGSNGLSVVEVLEMELNEINENFWKG